METTKLNQIFWPILVILFFCIHDLAGQELNYDSIIYGKKLCFKSGAIPTYYSPSCEKRALKVQSLLQKVVLEYSHDDSIHFKVELAVLDSSDMTGLGIPYGLFYSDEKKWLIIPGHFTFDKFAKTYGFCRFRDEMIKKFRTLTDHPEELIAETFYTRIPVHELGHYFARQILQAMPPDNFTNELIAIYFTTDYLYRNDRYFFNSMRAYSEVYSKETKPIYRSIKDFDTIYSNMKVQNYCGYQAIFQPMVNDIYLTFKSDFMYTFAKTFPRAGSPSALTQEEILKRLNKITSGKAAKWVKVIEGKSEQCRQPKK